jgi:hypothetical protein
MPSILLNGEWMMPMGMNSIFIFSHKKNRVTFLLIQYNKKKGKSFAKDLPLLKKWPRPLREADPVDVKK